MLIGRPFPPPERPGSGPPLLTPGIEWLTATASCLSGPALFPVSRQDSGVESWPRLHRVGLFQSASRRLVSSEAGEGSGMALVPGEYAFECTECDGKGEVEVGNRDYGDHDWVRCPNCHG